MKSVLKLCSQSQTPSSPFPVLKSSCANNSKGTPWFSLYAVYRKSTDGNESRAYFCMYEFRERRTWPIRTRRKKKEQTARARAKKRWETQGYMCMPARLLRRQNLNSKCQRWKPYPAQRLGNWRNCLARRSRWEPQPSLPRRRPGKLWNIWLWQAGKPKHGRA